MSENLNGNKPENGNGVEKGPTVVVPTIAAASPADSNAVDEVTMVIERGEAKPVPLENIEKGLTALWQAASKPKPGVSDTRGVTRACVFNFVICVDGEEQLAQATETIAQITWSYPCRAIVLVRKSEIEESSTTASISAHCQKPSSTGNRVCCEQITIVATGAAVEGLWSMVLPLLVPDLPVVLWWPGDPSIHEQLFERLLETSDRLIVDSRVFDKPITTFTRLAELYRKGYNTAFSDLSWTRLKPWRDALAQFFDTTEFLPYLSHIDNIEIQYEAPNDNAHPNFSEAMLLIGWLATQLSWQPVFNLQNRGNDAQLILSQAGAPLTVNFRGHNDQTDERGGITKLVVTASRPGETADGPWHHATFTVELSDDFTHASTTVVQDDGQPVTQKVLFPKPSQLDLLCENLALVHRDHLYESSLELAGHFNQK